MSIRLGAANLIMLIAVVYAPAARGQGYGTNLQNVLAPASGGMAGVSVAQPQDVTSAIFGNPATLTQFQGTHFSLGGGWVEGYPRVTYTPPQQDPLSARSEMQGFVVPQVGVIQDLRCLGLPGVLGLGLAGTSGVGTEYRGLAPGGGFINDTSGELLILGTNVAAGFEITDRLSLGATLTLGTGFEQLGLISPTISTAMVHDYALQGTFGADYLLSECTRVGAYYQTKEHFSFRNGVRITGPLNNTTYRDVTMDQPATIGLGIAHSGLCGGNLLLAADVYYLMWEDADLYRDVFVNQWAFALGAQLTRGKMKYRAGYSYNSSPINHSVGDSLDGIGIGRDAVQLFQAATLPTVNQHRISGGIGRQDFLFCGLDFDLYAGGMLKASDEFGNATASAAIYYLGMGLTWHYCATPAR